MHEVSTYCTVIEDRIFLKLNAFESADPFLEI